MGGVVGGVVVGGVVVPPSTLASTGYQAAAIFRKPVSFGWTPSALSATASYPVHRSARTIGDWAVVRPAAQDGSALLSAITSAGQVAQAEALIGMICATMIFMAEFCARIWPISLVNALSLSWSGMYPPHMSLVPRCIRTTSGRAAASHGGSWSLAAIPVAENPPCPSWSKSYE